MKITRRAMSVFLGATVASIALTAFGSTSAYAASTITTDVSEAAPGGSVQVTITPDPTTGLTDFCSSSTSVLADPSVIDTDTSNNVSGFSASVLLATEAGFESLTGNGVTSFNDSSNLFDGPGQGSFNPTTVSTPLVFSFTVPGDAVPGDYLFLVVCTGPTTYWAWEQGRAFLFEVTAAPGELPETGQETSGLAMVWGAGLATTLAGVALIVVMRRRAKA